MAKENVVRVDPGVLAEFKKAVLERHGKIRGVLQKEATEAIKKHIDWLRGEDR